MRLKPEIAGNFTCKNIKGKFHMDFLYRKIGEYVQLLYNTIVYICSFVRNLL